MSDNPAPPQPPPGEAFRPPAPLVIGLLGGVASGKSTVARAFAARGLVPIDADQVARQVVQRPAILAALTAAFGPGILGPDGQLDRAAMARVVFADPEARRRLESLTHPPIRETIATDIQSATAAGRSVVLDVPLLLEGGLIERCDVVVFVDASEATRRARALSRGWTAADWQQREAAQASLTEKASRAGYTIHNDGSAGATAAQVNAILLELAP